MKVTLVKQIKMHDNDHIAYDFDDDKIIVTMNYHERSFTDFFNFEGLADGHLLLTDELGNSKIETSLPILPLISAKKENDELEVELMFWINPSEATDDRKSEQFDTDEVYQVGFTKTANSNVEEDVMRQPSKYIDKDEKAVKKDPEPSDDHVKVKEQPGLPFDELPEEVKKEIEKDSEK